MRARVGVGSHGGAGVRGGRTGRARVPSKLRVYRWRPISVKVQSNLSKQPVDLGLQFSFDQSSVTFSLILSLNLISEQCHALAQQL